MLYNQWTVLLISIMVVIVCSKKKVCNRSARSNTSRGQTLMAFTMPIEENIEMIKGASAAKFSNIDYSNLSLSCCEFLCIYFLYTKLGISIVKCCFSVGTGNFNISGHFCL